MTIVILTLFLRVLQWLRSVDFAHVSSIRALNPEAMKYLLKSRHRKTEEYPKQFIRLSERDSEINLPTEFGCMVV